VKVPAGEESTVARESRAAFAARVASDNEKASKVPVGAQVEDWLFGTLTLGVNLGPQEDTQGWDLYEVRHSGLTHCWSSGSVVASFAKGDAS
jgi:hypothetical protein